MYEANKYFMKGLLIIVAWVAFVILAGIVLILSGWGEVIQFAILLAFFIFGICTSEFLLYRKCKGAIKSERKLYDEEQKVKEQATYKKEIQRNYNDEIKKS